MMKKHDDLEKIRNRIPLGTLNIEFYDMSSIKKKRDDFEEIRLTEIEYENLKEIYDKHNPLENGMLKRHNQYNDKGLDGMNKGDEDEYK